MSIFSSSELELPWVFVRVVIYLTKIIIFPQDFQSWGGISSFQEEIWWLSGSWGGITPEFSKLGWSFQVSGKVSSNFMIPGVEPSEFIQIVNLPSHLVMDSHMLVTFSSDETRYQSLVPQYKYICDHILMWWSYMFVWGIICINNIKTLFYYFIGHNIMILFLRYFLLMFLYFNIRYFFSFILVLFLI